MSSLSSTRKCSASGLLTFYCNSLIGKKNFVNFIINAFRLIMEISVSEDAEMNLINKLKQMCGFEYTSRMSKMYNDVQISKV